MQDGHLQRILRRAGVEDVLEGLGERLSPTDLQSLMLETYRRRAARITPAQIRAQYGRSRFSRPSPVDPRLLLRLEAQAFAHAPAFEPIELSPVCPLGTVSVLGDVSQNWVVPTARNTEVVSDPTNCMALECAARRDAGHAIIKLCASHRVVRAQDVSGPTSFAHFRLFALCTAGRDTGSFAFEFAALLEHLRFHVAYLSDLTREDVVVKLTAWEPAQEGALETLVAEPLRKALPSANIGLDRSRTRGSGYYDRFCFEVLVRDGQGNEHSLCDGGVTDWTAKLLSNMKERLVISAVGLERIGILFPPKP